MEDNSLIKISGWALLVVGLIIIFYSLSSSFSIFTGKKQLPQTFKTSGLNSTVDSTPKSQKELTSEEKAQKMLEEKMGEQLNALLPLDNFTKLFNLIAWAILTLIFIFGGTHISGLGIKLIKK